MRGVNKAIIVGTLGKDPEVRYMPSGGAVCSLSIATNETWKDKQTGEQKERTEWHNVTLYNRLAEIAGEYLKKGAQIYVEGSLRTEKWKDKNGQDRYTTKIMGRELQMLGGGSKNGESERTNSRQSGPSQQSPADEGFDDDIPF